MNALVTCQLCASHGVETPLMRVGRPDAGIICPRCDRFTCTCGRCQIDGRERICSGCGHRVGMGAR